MVYKGAISLPSQPTQTAVNKLPFHVPARARPFPTLRSDDVSFGSIVSGRQAAVPELEKVAGPAVTTVPVGLVSIRNILLPDFCKEYRTGLLPLTIYEQCGLQRINKLSLEAKEMCPFTDLALIQPGHCEGRCFLCLSTTVCQPTCIQS